MKLRRISEAPESVAVATPGAGGRRFAHEHPELWSSEVNRLHEERSHLTYALMFGPNDFNGLTDADLRVLFDAWGRDAGAWDARRGEGSGVWPETTYAHHRFVLGLSVDDAHAAAEEARERRSLAERAELREAKHK